MSVLIDSGVSVVARYEFAILVAQKLGEIPLDGRCAKNARLLFFKELPKRVSL